MALHSKGRRLSTHAVTPGQRLTQVSSATQQFLGSNLGVTGFPLHNAAFQEAAHHRADDTNATIGTLCSGIFAARATALATTRVHENERIVINVSGEEYETCVNTLQKFPTTLLGNPRKRAVFWDNERKHYFLDRHRPSFPAIIAFYQTGGKLHKPNEVPDDIFCEEIEFYELGEDVIADFKWKIGIIPSEARPEQSNSQLHNIWRLFEDPTSSVAARILALFSVLVIILSIIAFCVETLPRFKSSKCLDEHIDRLLAVNTTLSPGEVKHLNFVEELDFTNPFYVIETICVAWFTIELLFRFVCSPSKLQFIKNVMNVFDFLAIIPYFIQMIVVMVEERCATGEQSGMLQVLRVARLLRVMRIFKLSKHSKGLQILGYTFRRSFRELGLFLITLMVTALMFSSCMYFAELKTDSSHFGSIPESMWWSVITMTTVGYGDYYPQGVIGKVIGAVCALAGMIALAIPMPVIVTNFNNIYIHNKPKSGF